LIQLRYRQLASSWITEVDALLLQTCTTSSSLLEFYNKHRAAAISIQ